MLNHMFLLSVYYTLGCVAISRSVCSKLHKALQSFLICVALMWRTTLNNDFCLWFAKVATPANLTDDGLRQRHTASHPSTVPVAPIGAVQPGQPAEWVTNGQFPAVWANQAGVDPVTQQMLWWQQTYAQQYWAQYMQQFSSHQYPATPQSPSAGAPVQPVAQAGPVGPDPGRPVQPEEQQAQQQQRPRPPMAAVGGVAQDDEDDGVRAARDWLDWIYMGSRLAILLGVMYYYSSLPRFMLVTLIVAGIYLYQKAIHHRRHIVPPPDRHAEVNNNAEAPPQPVPVPADQVPADEAEPVAANQPDRAPTAPAQEAAAAAAAITPTAFNVAINVLIGFFSSLIPEVPAPEALN